MSESNMVVSNEGDGRRLASLWLKGEDSLRSAGSPLYSPQQATTFLLVRLERPLLLTDVSMGTSIRATASAQNFA